MLSRLEHLQPDHANPARQTPADANKGVALPPRRSDTKRTAPPPVRQQRRIQEPVVRTQWIPGVASPSVAVVQLPPGSAGAKPGRPSPPRGRVG